MYLSTNWFSMMLKPFPLLLSSLAWSAVVWDSWEEKRGGTKLLLRKSRYLQRGARTGWTGLTVLEDVWSRVKSGRMGFFLISRVPQIDQGELNKLIYVQHWAEPAWRLELAKIFWDREPLSVGHWTGEPRTSRRLRMLRVLQRMLRLLQFCLRVLWV